MTQTLISIETVDQYGLLIEEYCETQVVAVIEVYGAWYMEKQFLKSLKSILIEKYIFYSITGVVRVAEYHRYSKDIRSNMFVKK